MCVCMCVCVCVCECECECEGDRETNIKRTVEMEDSVCVASSSSEVRLDGVCE